MTRPADDGVPVLWHLKVSHYNEKARWALDYKGVPHVRRSVDPGAHRRIARRLYGGTTFPVIELGDRAIGDSTAILAELERLHPDPPLYPAGPDERRRALELEDFFDEELGPYTRLLAVHHLLADADLFLATFVPDLAAPRRLLARATFGRIRRRVVASFGIDAESVEHAFQKLRSAGRRFQAEVGADDYLVGGRFSVADLTLAALVAPVVAPEQFPYRQPQRGHPLVEPVVKALAEDGIVDWARRIYSTHRGRSAALAD